MQPTVQSQARLRRLVWLFGFLLTAAIVAGGYHTYQLNREISRLSADFDAKDSALADLRRRLADAHLTAKAAAEVASRTRDRAEAAEEARNEAEAIARTADTVRSELEARLQAAQAARDAAEAKLRALTERQSGEAPE